MLLKGVEKKTVLLKITLIRQILRLETFWYIFNLKVGVHSFVWSTKTFLFDLRELRYKLNNIGYQISKNLNNEQSNIL